MNFVKLLFILTFLTGCTINHSHAKTFPVESFVKINVHTSTLRCKEDKNTMVSRCLKEDYYSVGSGSVVGKDKYHSYILTAGHVCITDVKNTEKFNTIVTTHFLVENRKSEVFEAEIFVVHPEMLKGNKKADLCLIKTKVPTKMPIIKLSTIPPKMGDVVYNVSAPGGFFIPPSVPMFSGHFSGRINEWHNLVTIPAIGGSSGSPVVNKRGRLIGMIFAANLQLHHLSISMNHDVVTNFIKENLYRHPPL